MNPGRWLHLGAQRWLRFWFTPTSGSVLALMRTMVGLASLGWAMSILPDLRTFYFDDGLLPPPRYADYRLGAEYPRQFDRWGRYVLATAPLAGWLVDLLHVERDPLVSDVVTALLAGSILYTIVRRELPQDEHSSFPWFLAGALVYLVLA